MKILVCGSRDYSNRTKIFESLREHDPDLIMQGGAKGADSIALEYAVANQIDRITYNADWAKHGKKAGIFRNIRMLREGKPNLVLAFYSDWNNKSKGTSHMVSIALAEPNVQVIEYD